MDEEKMIQLIDRFLEGEATTEELEELNLIYDKLDRQPSLISSLSLPERKELYVSMLDKINDTVHYSEVRDGGEDSGDHDSK